jgi:hypothetical protein
VAKWAGLLQDPCNVTYEKLSDQPNHQEHEAFQTAHLLELSPEKRYGDPQLKQYMYRQFAPPSGVPGWVFSVQEAHILKDSECPSSAPCFNIHTFHFLLFSDTLGTSPANHNGDIELD